MIAYLGLFAAAFVAATLLPMQSEAVLGALAHRGGHPLLLLWAVATAGNVLGSVVNYGLGRWLAQFEGRRWFPASPGQIRRAEGWYRRWGRWSLLASWLPLVGDPLTVVAGMLRERLSLFLLLVTLAKGGRYVAVIWIATGWN
ncbi:DedA family protein [Haematobacter massiliensis]|uniref:Membrane protein n=1 Tax=Haematobacter massiliensis TaxID=195105 RepID=A0A086Y381_9RHOB|nr:YqaA family protein [Haematobacter massiliensis]KFI28731.1 membrane protein [Haematobacter massiliensis]OWJ69577.1 DedA family protein [Haematobacter massiliensis]OWJ86834.1 DedA family protein [Haematobacter massiliensis]QBJ26273.1 DedA family protein [Haematobacter massiliensis]